VDARGHSWVQVTGPDSDRRTVTGWVAAQYVTPHPQGGENATGRIDQAEQGQGDIAVTVRPGDTIDGIAARYGKDPAQAAVVNNGHIIDPNLIFPGDTVYLASGTPATRSAAASGQ
jgi:LysM domain